MQGSKIFVVQYDERYIAYLKTAFSATTTTKEWNYDQDFLNFKNTPSAALKLSYREFNLEIFGNFFSLNNANSNSFFLHTRYRVVEK